MPIFEILGGCCAPAMEGHAAAPPRNVMKVRRCMCPRKDHRFMEGLKGSTSQPTVRFGSKADMCGATRYVRFVPIADIDHVSHSDPRAKRETAVVGRSLRGLV